MNRKEHARKYRVAVVGAAGLALTCLRAGGPASATSGCCDGSLSCSRLDTSATASTNTRHLVVADGMTDIVAVILDADSVTVLPGEGDGTFSTGEHTPSASTPTRRSSPTPTATGTPTSPQPTSGAHRSASC